MGSNLWSCSQWNNANKEKKAQCSRNWREAHREEIAEYNRQYRLEHPDKMRELKRRWQQENADRLRIRSRRWREAHKEEIAERRRHYRLEHREEIRERRHHWREANPEKRREYKRQHRARKLKATVENVDGTFIYERDRYACVYCNSPFNLSLDHVVALGSGGEHSYDNLVMACRGCNSSKGTQEVFQWLASSKYRNKEDNQWE